MKTKAGHTDMFSTFQRTTQENPVLRNDPCVLEVDGKRVAVSNGKKHWRHPGYCKSAIRGHLDYWYDWEDVEQAMLELMGSGRVKIVLLSGAKYEWPTTRDLKKQIAKRDSRESDAARWAEKIKVL